MIDDCPLAAAVIAGSSDRPLAALTLMISSNFVGCSTGDRGFGAREDLVHVGGSAPVVVAESVP